MACLFFLIIILSTFAIFFYKTGLPVIQEVKKLFNFYLDGNFKNHTIKSLESNIIFNKIQKDYREKKINHIEYNKAVFYAAFYPKEKKNTYKGELPGKRAIDMRVHLQSLVDNYKKLDFDTKDKLQKVIFPEKNKLKSKKSSILSPVISTIAYAEEIDSLLFPESYEITQNVWVNGFDGYFFDENMEIIENSVLDSMETFDSMGFDRPSFRIDIIIEEQPSFMTSYSVFVKPDIFDNTVPEYRIFIDKNCSPEDLEAYIAHELFHAYQEQALLSLSFSHVEKDKLEFVKEATAIWAVDQVYPDNNYELEFAECIYNDPIINYCPYDICKSYTWYQMFFYFTDVKNTANHGYVRNIFDRYEDFQDFDKVFDLIHIERDFFNNDFADFGMALWGKGKYEDIFLQAEPQYPYLLLNEEIIETSDMKDVIKNEGDDWDVYEFEAPGYYYKEIKISENFDGSLIIQQNLSMQESKQMTGMRVGISKYDSFEWLNNEYEPGMVVVDIGGSIERIDSIVLMFFSTSFEEKQSIQYKVTSSDGQKAKGSIIFKLEKTFNPSSGVSGKERFTFVAGEELIKASYQPAGQPDNTISHMIGGEKYIVGKLEGDYIYEYLFKKEKDETKITGIGHYTYCDDKYQQSQNNSNISGLPLLPGLSDKINDELFSHAGKALKELEKVKGNLNGSDIPKLPDLPQMESLPEMDNDMSGNIFNVGADGLPRIVIRPEIKVFEFMPSLPADIENKDWVEYESVYKFPDPNDPKKIKTETQNYKDKPTQLFPLWFCNPDFAENADNEGIVTEDPQFDVQDTKQLVQKLISYHAKFNRFNIQKLNDNPHKLFERDFRQEIDPKPDYAVLKQKASFIDNRFQAELQAKAITTKGNVIEISITVEYTFE